MAAVTNPFEKFGGTASGPGMTSLWTAPVGPPATIPSAATASATAAAKPAPYMYAGQGWNDPLAQQIFKEFNPYGSADVNASVAREAAASKGYIGSGGYHTFLDPKEWGGSYRGDEFDKMKAAYLARGGQGTYDQLAATNPTSVGWPTDTSGNALPKYSADMTQKLYPSGTQGFQPPAPGSAEASGGLGSSFSLTPEILKKMWR